MRYFFLILIFLSSFVYSAEVYWAVNNHNGATPQEAAKSLCDLNSSICASFKIDPYHANPSRNDLLTAVFYTDTYSSNVWTTATISMLPCGYNGITNCSIYNYEQSTTVCPDGFYSNAANALGYIDTCDRPAIKQCSDGTFKLTTGICPIQLPVCNSYESCLEFAQSKIDCTGSENINFSYIDPENFSYSCDKQDTENPNSPADSEWFGCSSETGLCGGIDTSPISSSSSSQSSSEEDSSSSVSSWESSSAASSSITESSVSSTSTSTTSSSGSSDQVSGPCNPTASDYLNCISHSKKSITTPERGHFDETISQQKLADLEAEYSQKIRLIKDEINSHFSLELSSANEMKDICKTIMSVEVCFGFAKWSGILIIISNTIIFICAVISFGIIMRR